MGREESGPDAAGTPTRTPPPARPPRWPDPHDAARDDGGQPSRHADVRWATAGYLGAAFLVPLIPLAVYLLGRSRSAFLRRHAATALNLSLTAVLYWVCCAILGGLLLADSVTAALAVALPLGSAIWLAMLRYLLRGVTAASRGQQDQAPDWICVPMVR